MVLSLTQFFSYDKYCKIKTWLSVFDANPRYKTITRAKMQQVNR